MLRLACGDEMQFQAQSESMSRSRQSADSGRSLHLAPGRRSFLPGILAVAVTLACGDIAAGKSGARAGQPSEVESAQITVSYPSDASVFPPDILAPTVIWHDAQAGSTAWRIEVTFGDGSRRIQAISSGELMQVGELDQRCLAAGGVRPELTPQQALAHTWKPDEVVWEAIKKHSVNRPALITITGFRDEKLKAAVSRGQVSMTTSKDPVAAPIFYRDVPLIPVEGERGVIKPLPESATKLITWRLKSVSEPGSRALIAGFPTCANCHSFSGDGKMIGLDVDGPQNDKGLYAMVPVHEQTIIKSENVIKWNSFQTDAKTKRFGFMTQISPNGRYIVTSIENPGSQVKRLDDRFYNAGYKDIAFGQVFFPTRGALAWYSRETGKLQVLPGADDPRYVQACAVWSPDGKYIYFLRAEARDPYPEGGKESQYANSPDETQIQYDIYRLPFNAGQGGVAEPVAGAGQNGKSNSFPKISPDGRWMVWVQAHNGLLMRPDSELYIVPAEGGTPRRLGANGTPMNSWHSWSPNGRWLVFSSKRNRPYTQMFLTHIDEEGNDSPAILIENATTANRAVNIPEFVNIPYDGLQRIDSPATEFYRLFDVALDLTKKKQYEQAIPEWTHATELEPSDAKSQYNLGVALARTENFAEAIPHYRKALEIKPDYAEAYTNIGRAQAAVGKPDEAIASFTRALEMNPKDATAETNLGSTLAEKGNLDQAVEHFRMALEISPDDPDAQYNLAMTLARTGKTEEAVPQFEKALVSDPNSVDVNFNYGRVLALRGRFDDAIARFEKAAASNPGSPEIQYNLGRVLASTGRFDEAIPHLRSAVESSKPGSSQSAEAHNTLGFAMAAKGDYDQAAGHFQKALQLKPDFAEAHYNLGNVLYYVQNKPADAFSHWREAMRLEPNNIPALNRAARVLSTSPQASVRNGIEAVKLAERAVQLSGAHEAAFLDTLAAAYAEAGQFQLAVQTALRALELARQANNSHLTEALDGRLALYRTQTALREK